MIKAYRDPRFAELDALIAAGPDDWHQYDAVDPGPEPKERKVKPKPELMPCNFGKPHDFRHKAGLTQGGNERRRCVYCGRTRVL